MKFQNKLCAIYLRKHFIHLFILIHFTMLMGAQGIQVGEKCPDVAVKNILNYKMSATTLSHFWDKPTIIDFWSTTCSACIQSFPKTDSLAKLYGNEVNFVLATFENESKAKELFAKFKRLNHIKLISVVSDTILRLLFPYNGLPHVIWLGKGGIVKAITSGKAVTEDKVRLFALNKELNLPVKKTEEEYHIGSILASINPEESSKHISKYTYLSSKRDDIPGGKFSISNNDGFFRVHGTNQDIFFLYQVAFGKFYDRNFAYNRMFFINNNGSLQSVIGSERKKICYDMLLKDTSKVNGYSLMKADLDREMGWTSMLIKRKIRCAILRRTSTVDKLKSGKGAPPDVYFEGGYYIASNVTLQTIIQSRFNANDFFPYPMIDETNYTGRINIKLPENFRDVEGLREALQDYDVDLIFEERELEVILFRR